MAALTVRDRLEDLVESTTKNLSVKSVTIAAFVDLIRKQFVEKAMLVVKEFVPNNAEKKALVLEYAGRLFDVFAPKIALVLPWYLFWLKPFLAAQARDQFLTAISNLIEIIFVEKFKPAV